MAGGAVAGHRVAAGDGDGTTLWWEAGVGDAVVVGCQAAGVGAPMAAIAGEAP